MKNSARGSKVAVSADGRGLVSRARAVLLWETMRMTGLGRSLSAALEPWRAPRAVHDPDKIITGLAVALALAGDCLADIAVLRDQPELAEPVASDPVVSRLVKTLAADEPQALEAIRAARAAARERAWALAGDAAPSPRRTPPAAADRRTLALGPADHRCRHPPAGTPVRLTGRNHHYGQERSNPGLVGPPPTGATAGQPAMAATPKSFPAEPLRPALQARERSRLGHSDRPRLDASR